MKGDTQLLPLSDKQDTLNAPIVASKKQCYAYVKTRSGRLPSWEYTRHVGNTTLLVLPCS